MTTGKNLDIELNVIDEIVSIAHCIPKFSDGLLRFEDVCKHCFHLADCVMTAFNLQTLNHTLLGIVGYGGLVE